MTKRLNDNKALVKNGIPPPEGMLGMGPPTRARFGMQSSPEASVSIQAPSGKPNPAPDSGSSLRRSVDYLCER